MFREPFPILHVEDVERSARFYADSFGFEEDYRFPEAGPPEFVFLKLGEMGVGIAGKGPPPLPDWPPDRPTGAFQLCIYTDDAEAAAERLREAGVEQLTAARSMPWGEQLAFFSDPDGNLIHVTSVID
jgi:catechol 2,3-dioxygenase-like lactoylglutathione lyase family enzyme